MAPGTLPDGYHGPNETLTPWIIACLSNRTSTATKKFLQANLKHTGFDIRIRTQVKHDLSDLSR